MEDYRAMIRSVFEMGSIQDAQTMFGLCVRNAFPTNDFRRLELIRFTKTAAWFFPLPVINSGIPMNGLNSAISFMERNGALT